MLCNSSFFFISFISLCFWLATQHKATQHNTAQHSTAHDEKNSNNINSKNKMHVLDIVWHLHCTLHTHKHTSSWTHLEKKKYFLQLCIMQISGTVDTEETHIISHKTTQKPPTFLWTATRSRHRKRFMHNMYSPLKEYRIILKCCVAFEISANAEKNATTTTASSVWIVTIVARARFNKIFWQGDLLKSIIRVWFQ